ncbi:hypothetical protein GH714_031999 [Hevea brasiliensis]|uniref:LOB domain-containing protein n=1 Tax=Hevea brasiliensis TaxID=3981 RepID=A0A6A6L1L7_HEVBR|nr:hypothetical protein GH714_031999 [Hevea brasiliensis]
MEKANPSKARAVWELDDHSTGTKREMDLEGSFRPSVSCISRREVFGASNVAKLLNELSTAQREDAVNSLAYEAEERLRDPVYGCVGLISILQQRLKQLQNDLYHAKKELAQYIGLVQCFPFCNPRRLCHNSIWQLAAAMAVRDQQEMFRAYDQQQQQQQQHQQHQNQSQHQQELVRFNSGFDAAGSVTATGYNQLSSASAMSPSLALGTYDNPFQIQPQAEHHHHQLQAQLLIQPQQPQQTQQQQQRSGSEEGRSVGPSC